MLHGLRALGANGARVWALKKVRKCHQSVWRRVRRSMRLEMMFAKDLGGGGGGCRDLIGSVMSMVGSVVIGNR